LAKLGNLLSDIPSGRLTLTTGVPVTTSSVAAATTLYYTPYIGNKISLYNGYEWLFHEFDELSLSLSGYTADTNYDIFMYNNSGTLTLESTAWSTATARATEITRLEGIYTKSGSTTRRYLGTIRTTDTTGQCNDGESHRFVWNYYNRVNRRIHYNYTGSNHTYTGTSWRYWNNDSDSKVDFVIGVIEDSPTCFYGGEVKNSNDNSYSRVGVGIDTSSDNIVQLGNFGTATGQFIYGIAGGTISLQYQLTDPGYHYISALEKVDSNTGTFGNLRLHVELRA